MAFTSSYTPGLIQQSEYYYGTPEMTPGLSGSFSGSFQGDGSALTNLPSTDPFPFTGDAQITGSLTISGSFHSFTLDSDNIILGSGSGVAMEADADNNVILGVNAGNSITTGNGAVIIGKSAGQTYTTGNLNAVLIGTFAGQNLTSAYGHTAIAIGNNALNSPGNGASGTIAIGDSAAYSNQGTHVVAIGTRAAYGAGTGQGGTVAIGYNAMFTQGHANSVAIGKNALYSAVNGGVHTTAVGMSAGYGITSGDGNTVYGYYAGYSLAGSGATGNIIIGSGSLGASGISNQLRIGNGNSIVTISGSLETGDVIFHNTASAPNFSGSFQGDGSQLTNLNTTTPTLQEVTTQGNITNQGLIVTGSTTFKPISSGNGGAIELTNIGYSGLDNPIMTFKDGQGNSNVVIGHRANDGQIQIYDQPDSLRTVLSANFSAFNPGSTTGNGTYFGLTSSMAPTSTNGRAYIKMYEASYSGAPAYNFQLNNRNYAAGSGTIGLYGIMSTTSTAAPAIQITSINSDKVVNFGGPSFIHSSGKQNNYLKYGLQIGGGFTGTNANMPLTDGSLIMSGSGGLFSIKSVSSEAEIKTNNGATTLTLGTTSSFTAVSASSYISASKFIGDGSQLTNLPPATAGSTSGRVVFTTTNGELTSETGFTYDATTDRLTVPNLTTTTFTASFITSSQIHTSGSNIFGDDTTDTQTLIGTTKMTGSAQITGNTEITGSFLVVAANSATAPTTQSLKIDSNGYFYHLGYHDGNNTAFANNSSNTVIGNDINNDGDFYATVIGYQADVASTAASIGIGAQSNVDANSSIAIGASARTNTTTAISLGYYAGNHADSRGINIGKYAIGKGEKNIVLSSTGLSTVSPTKANTFGIYMTDANPNFEIEATGSSTLSGSSFTIEKSGSTVFEVIGSEGTLFSVDDDLDGTLLDVKDRSGIPVLQASASGEIYLGQSPQSLYTTAVISSTNADVTQSLYGLDTSSYGGAFFDYIAHSGSNARGGTVSSVWTPGGSVVFSETTTTHIGDTSNLNLVVHFSQSQAQLACYADTSQYNIKVITRAI